MRSLDPSEPQPTLGAPIKPAPAPTPPSRAWEPVENHPGYRRDPSTGSIARHDI